MSVLAIDVGNTRTGFGVFTGGKAQDPAVRLASNQFEKDLIPTLEHHWKCAQKETSLNEDEDCEIVLATVVPAIADRIESAINKHLGQKVQRIGRDLIIPLKTMLRDDATVGQDRLLAALAAYINVESACVTIHLGTALVVDCIDDDGIFRGGAIAPGLKMAASALHEHTAQLPDASLTPPAEDVSFGRFTQEAINLGLFVGMRGAIRELIERYATALGHWPHVIATGGDAQAVLGDTEIIESFVPDLVLQGVALVWEHDRE